MTGGRSCKCLNYYQAGFSVECVGRTSVTDSRFLVTTGSLSVSSASTKSEHGLCATFDYMEGSIQHQPGLVRDVGVRPYGSRAAGRGKTRSYPHILSLDCVSLPLCTTTYTSNINRFIPSLFIIQRISATPCPRTRHGEAVVVCLSARYVALLTISKHNVT